MTTRPDLLPVGELPPVGVVPRRMHAQVIRRERFGAPSSAFQTEIVDVPEPGPDEVLVAVMAAGVNYNNVWAARGYPVDVIAQRRLHGQEDEPFHIGGSDASGIVYQVGSAVRHVRVGDEVILHCVQWKQDDPWLAAGRDPLGAPSSRIWGFESNWGAFAQFTKVQARQCQPRPRHLTWAQAASYLLCGTTVYRMLHHWQGNTLQKGDVVLVWGGAGGLGVLAIQLVRRGGGIPIAVVSSEERGRLCVALGAEGYINRKHFSHWGALTHEINTEQAFSVWAKEARKFGRAIWEIAGRNNSPRIVLEHPGEETLPTSLFVCDTGGMVVTCAGTTGYNATLDLRYLWMRQKRLQGSHAGDDLDAERFNALVQDRKIDPVLSHVFGFEQTGECHQLMADNRAPLGNMAIVIGASHLEPTGPRPSPLQ
ncbi:crotonyl-CoA carboxylase/reductase [Pyxidicoccus sp. 3LG]